MTFEYGDDDEMEATSRILATSPGSPARMRGNRLHSTGPRSPGVPHQSFVPGRGLVGSPSPSILITGNAEQPAYPGPDQPARPFPHDPLPLQGIKRHPPLMAQLPSDRLVPQLERVCFLVFGMMVGILALFIVAAVRKDWGVATVLTGIIAVGFFVLSGLVYVAKRLP